MKIPIEKERQLYQDYYEYCCRMLPTPKLYREMVRRHHGKIKVLALDLEWTLITDAKTGWPRPGLYNFLEACKDLFNRIVIYTAAPEELFRKVARDLVEWQKKAPAWFADLEYIQWPRKGYKDLSRIPGVEPHQALIVDDYRPYIHPEQLFQWVFIHPYGDLPDYADFEFNRVLGVLELIQLKAINRERILTYLKEQVDFEMSGIQRLWIYGAIAEGKTNAESFELSLWESPLEIAMQIDPVEEVQSAKHIPANQFEMNTQAKLRNYFWIDVKFVARDDQREAITIENSWEPFHAVFTRSPGRIDIVFPDLPGCKGECLRREDDKYFDEVSLQAYDPAREILTAWLQAATPNDIPGNRFSEKELHELYPGSSIHLFFGQFPWRKNA